MTMLKVWFTAAEAAPFAKTGGLGDVAVKKFLNEIMQQILGPIRTHRHEFEQDIPFVIEVLKQGTEKAYSKAAKTLEKVRRAMKLNHFEAGLKLQSDK